MKQSASIKFILLLQFLAAMSAYAQLSSVDDSQFEIHFTQSEIEFKGNELVSNPLRIVNKSLQKVSVYLEISAPPGWMKLGSSNRLFEVPPKDTIYIPLRVVPAAKAEGNTMYSINAFVRSDEGLPLGAESFFCFTKKMVSWEMSVLPEDKIYLKNGEEIGQFSLNMLNTGNFQDEFQLSLRGADRADVVLMDTMGNIIRNPSYTVSLDGGQDTNFTFLAQPSNFQRNFRTVSINSHRPVSESDEKRFRIYATSQEAQRIENDLPKKGSKVDFIRLANEKKVSPYGAQSIPLIVETQIQNIMSDYSFMAMNLRGLKQFDQDKRLVYYSQLLYSQNYFNPNFFDNLPWFVGYYDKNWDVQVGLISGRTMGLPSAGKGISGGYQINRAHRVGGYINRSPGLFGPQRVFSSGLYHEYSGSKIRVTTSLGHNRDSLLNANSSILSSRANFRIANNHNISALGGISLTNYTDTTVQSLGYIAGLTYSGRMLDGKLVENLSSRYSSKGFGFSSSERASINNRASYELSKGLQIQLLNNLNYNRNYLDRFSDSVTTQFTSLFNRLNLMMRTKKGTLQPGLFYEIISQPAYTNHFRGAAFTYSNFNFSKNTLYSANIKLGYNRPIDFPEIKEYFTGQFSLLARIRTTTFNARYFFGPSNPLILLNNVAGTYPQSFRFSAQNQYLFKNQHFMLQSGGNYTFNNQTSSHSASIFPEFFFFTNDGWRFSVNMNYTFTSSNFKKVSSSLNPIRGLEETDPKATINNTVRFGATIRKEFGVPIPFVKKKNHNVMFVAFYDLNGDGIRDRDEPTIENAVITLKDDQVITNIKGEANLINVPEGFYHIGVNPLSIINGWFPDLPDSTYIAESQTLNIPFTRGVKVSGKVIIDLDERTQEDGEIFDLSNIKITAVNGKVFNTLTSLDGSFEFYLPNGTYTITLDEGVLTSKYQLMKNNIEVTLNKELENLFVTFFIVEKRRTLNIKKFGK